MNNATYFTNAKSEEYPQANCKSEGFSWLDHWKLYNGSTINLCPVIEFGNRKCGNKPTLGAHIKYYSVHPSSNQTIYIIPMCTEHNNMRENLKLTLADTRILAPSTCERHS
jgi:hypothetical protein